MSYPRISPYLELYPKSQGKLHVMNNMMIAMNTYNEYLLCVIQDISVDTSDGICDNLGISVMRFMGYLSCLVLRLIIHNILCT